MKSCAAVLGVCLLVTGLSANDEAPDVRAYLPLFERNSLGRKVLDVRYSDVAGKKTGHLIFDSDKGKYREEVDDYTVSLNTNIYFNIINVCNGVKYISFQTPVTVTQQSDAGAAGRREFRSSGHAHIEDRAFVRIPEFAAFYYDRRRLPFAKSVYEQRPQIKRLSDDTITLETTKNRFEFSRNSCALRKIEYLYTNTKAETIAWRTYELSNPVDCSGTWIPLRIIVTERDLDGKERYRGETTVDPKTLRLMDSVDDSCFEVALPTGCAVQDDVLKKTYVITAPDGNLPQSRRRPAPIP